MNDEAVPIYYAMIDQMTLGHEFLSVNFGDRFALFFLFSFGLSTFPNFVPIILSQRQAQDWLAHW